MSSDQDLAIQLATINEQVSNVSRKMDKMESNIAQIMDLDKTIASLDIHHQNSKKDITLLWEREERLKEDIGNVDKKVEAFTNTFKGGFRTFIWLMTFMQACIFGCIMWVFTNVTNANSLNSTQEVRIERLERQLTEPRLTTPQTGEHHDR
jgi:uncharacterized coiled-coil protein SlyX